MHLITICYRGVVITTIVNLCKLNGSYIIMLRFLTEQMTASTQSKYTTTEYGKQNMFAAEAPMEYVEDYKGYWVEAERTNGRLAMIGLFALVHNYVLFGWIIPGIA